MTDNRVSTPGQFGRALAIHAGALLLGMSLAVLSADILSERTVLTFLGRVGSGTAGALIAVYGGLFVHDRWERRYGRRCGLLKPHRDRTGEVSPSSGGAARRSGAANEPRVRRSVVGWVIALVVFLLATGVALFDWLNPNPFAVP